MSEIEQLLDRAGRSCETTPSPDVVEADVRRGRAALARRHRRRVIGSSAGGSVAVAAIVAGTILVGGTNGTENAPAASGPKTTAHTQLAPQQLGSGVRLVAYTGKQPAGFIVHQAPQGWYIQDQDHPRFSLSIAPKGNTTSSDDFSHKLVVMLLSSSAPQGLPKNGDHVVVNGKPGVIVPGDEADTLTYLYPDGRYVQVQAWRNLGWSNDQLVRFAEGVTVTSEAKAGVG